MSDRKTRAVTLASVLESGMRKLANVSKSGPMVRYQKDPVLFANEILGVQLWARQIEILEAVRDHDRVSVSAAQKVGKSHVAAVAALWKYCCFEDARVFLTAPTSRQIDSILFREIRTLFAKSILPIEGTIGQLARSGLKAPDFREITGATAISKEALAGLSGHNILYIVDEASGVADDAFEVMDGNLAGGGRSLWISNPTRARGAFFDSHHSKREFFKTITISALDSPNVIEGREVVKGLARRDYIDEKREELSEDSPVYKIRILGEFVYAEQGRVVSVAELTDAETRWPTTPAKGRLYIGVDPAGPGSDGDESAFACRRGQKITRVIARRGLTPEMILGELLSLISLERIVDDTRPAQVVIDRDGPVGANAWNVLRNYSESHPHAFQVYGVRGGELARRKPDQYARTRDEVWASFGDWVRNGGALPPDSKLGAEVTAPAFEVDIRGHARVTQKNILRTLLGRSPDRADAACLCTWEVQVWTGDEFEVANASDDEPNERNNGLYAPPVCDPYAGTMGLDPYGDRRTNDRYR